MVENLKLLIPVAAIVISVISLLRTNVSNRRQIRAGKLEEIMECLQFCMYQYKPLYRIQKMQAFYKLAPENTCKVQVETSEKNYLDAVEKFKERVNLDKMQDKMSRLSVLSNSYLPDTELKSKVISIVTMMTNLTNCTIFGNFESSRLLFTKYPDAYDFMMYIQKINGEILKEMNLGYKGAETMELFDYKAKFMQDLKISE